MVRAQGLMTGLSAGLASALPERLVGAAIRRVYPRVEPELARAADYVPRGGTAVDVGAWYGPWTCRLAAIADKVVAVEPTTQLAGHLRAAFPTITIVEAAASDHDGTGELFMPASGPGVGVSSLEQASDESVTVRLVTLDSLALTDVRFLKLDVEGHELPALRGAAETIRRDGPVLLVELEERIQPIEPVVELLRDWGYEGFVLPDDQWVRLSEFALVDHQRACVDRVSQSFIRRVVWPRPRYVNSVLFRRV